MAGDEHAPHALAARDLTFRAGDRVLLHPVDLAFREGEVAAIVGHNGSGKSTLLRLLARQAAPSGGEIRLEGRAVAGWPGRSFARHVAYLPQETPQGLGITVAELVAQGRYPWHGALGRFGDEDRRKVAEAMALTHVDELAGRMVDTLSGGECQRVWLAMLVAQDSRCLLLDEPISALDIAHQIEVLALVRRLARERALSVVVVLHDINMAARFCDRIHALKDGRLIAAGAPADIMRGETLGEIFGVRMAVIENETTGSPLAYAL